MNVETLSDARRRIRRDVRAFLMTATAPQLARELEISQDRGDAFRAECVRELIAEDAS